MNFFEAEDGARLAYSDEGEGLPLLALAGLTRDGRDFDYLAPHLPQGIRLLRLDMRGRGQSAWTGAASYTVAQEARDTLSLLDHLGIARAAILGSSRGGLIGMLLALTAKTRLLGLCANDVGVGLDLGGRRLMTTYVGVAPAASSLSEVARRLPLAMQGFENVPESRWQAEAERHFTEREGRVGLPYDPALAEGFAAVKDGPLPDAWPLFEACAGLPLALVRGAASDLLSRATAEEMKARNPALLFADVPGRAHIPFLDEPQALAVIRAWLAEVAAFAASETPAA